METVFYTCLGKPCTHTCITYQSTGKVEGVNNLVNGDNYSNIVYVVASVCIELYLYSRIWPKMELMLWLFV